MSLDIAGVGVGDASLLVGQGFVACAASEGSDLRGEEMMGQGEGSLSLGGGDGDVEVGDTNQDFDVILSCLNLDGSEAPVFQPVKSEVFTGTSTTRDKESFSDQCASEGTPHDTSNQAVPPSPLIDIAQYASPEFLLGISTQMTAAGGVSLQSVVPDFCESEGEDSSVGMGANLDSGLSSIRRSMSRIDSGLSTAVRSDAAPFEAADSPEMATGGDGLLGSTLNQKSALLPETASSDGAFEDRVATDLSGTLEDSQGSSLPTPITFDSSLRLRGQQRGVEANSEESVKGWGTTPSSPNIPAKYHPDLRLPVPDLGDAVREMGSGVGEDVGSPNDLSLGVAPRAIMGAVGGFGAAIPIESASLVIRADLSISEKLEGAAMQASAGDSRVAFVGRSETAEEMAPKLLFAQAEGLLESPGDELRASDVAPLDKVDETAKASVDCVNSRTTLGGQNLLGVASGPGGRLVQRSGGKGARGSGDSVAVSPTAQILPRRGEHVMGSTLGRLEMLSSLSAKSNAALRDGESFVDIGSQTTLSSDDRFRHALLLVNRAGGGAMGEGERNLVLRADNQGRAEAVLSKLNETVLRVRAERSSLVVDIDLADGGGVSVELSYSRGFVDAVFRVSDQGLRQTLESMWKVLPPHEKVSALDLGTVSFERKSSSDSGNQDFKDRQQDAQKGQGERFDQDVGSGGEGREKSSDKKSLIGTPEATSGRARMRDASGKFFEQSRASSEKDLKS